MKYFHLAVLSAAARAGDGSFTPEKLAEEMGVSLRAVKTAADHLLMRGRIFECEKDGLPGRYTLHPRRREFSALKENESRGRKSLAAVRQAEDKICWTLQAEKGDIENPGIMSRGMTNDSYFFTCKGRKYIYRLSGRGSDRLVDRYRERANYRALKDSGIGDEVLCHDPEAGIKISGFIEDSFPLDTENPDHIAAAVKAVKELHQSGIEPPGDFDIQATTEEYEELCREAGHPLFDGYENRKAKVAGLLKKAVESDGRACFCHMDFVPGNCLMRYGKEGLETVLIDWEYAGGCHPFTDVAMFCLSAAFDRERSDALLNIYLEREATGREKGIFYALMSSCALMWHLWGRYKTRMGEDYSDYCRRMKKTCLEYSPLAEKLLTS